MGTRVHIYSTERTNEVIRRIRLWSDTTRLKSTTGGYKVRVGVAKDGQTFWLGQWNQYSQTLKAHEYIDLTGIPDLNHPLEPGSVCVVEIDTQGSPGQGSVGMAVEWKFTRVGETGDEPTSQRLDDVIFPPSRGVRPLFSLGRHVNDPDLRAAIEPIEEDLNTSGVTEWVLSVPLPAISGGSTEAVAFAEVFDYGHVVVMVPPSGFAQLNLTVFQITPPDPTVPYRLDIGAGAAVTAAGPGAAYGEMYLYDQTQPGYIAPMPMPAPPQGAKVGTAGVAPGVDFGQGAIHSVGYPIPAGTGPVTIVLVGNAPLGNLEWHDPWISGRLYRDLYVV
jgi:hypothetical protein